MINGYYMLLMKISKQLIYFPGRYLPFDLTNMSLLFTILFRVFSQMAILHCLRGFIRVIFAKCIMRDNVLQIIDNTLFMDMLTMIIFDLCGFIKVCRKFIMMIKTQLTITGIKFPAAIPCHYINCAILIIKVKREVIIMYKIINILTILMLISHHRCAIRAVMIMFF